MDVYDALNTTIYDSDDILEFSNNLIKFVELALLEKNKTTVVKNFYEKFFIHNMVDYAFANKWEKDDIKYFISDKKNAVGKYMAFSLPVQSTPAKTLQDLNNFAKNTLKTFIKPIGEGISVKKVDEILKYMDDRFDLSKILFSDVRSTFSVLDITHKFTNSQCLSIKKVFGTEHHFFLYCMGKKNSIFSPEEVFFHELGQAVLFRFTNSSEKIPSSLLDIIEKAGFPAINQQDTSTQAQLVANVMTIGMIYDSPFEECHHLKGVNVIHKQFYQKLFKEMLGTISEDK